MFQHTSKKAKKGAEIRRALYGKFHRACRDGLQSTDKFSSYMPFISYSQIQTLVHFAAEQFAEQEDHAYCPLLIQTERRYVDSKETALEYMDQISYAVNKLPARPIQKVRETFESHLLVWQKCDQLQRLRAVLATAEIPDGIQKIVVIGCGDFAFEAHEVKKQFCLCNRQSLFMRLTQHALVLSLKEILEDRSGKKGSIKIYAQDPGYTGPAKEILAEHGITVMADPEGFLQIDEPTVVVSITPSICVRQIVADIARPARMTWDRVGMYRDGILDEQAYM